jgi:hypothetical protein
VGRIYGSLKKLQYSKLTQYYRAALVNNVPDIAKMKNGVCYPNPTELQTPSMNTLNALTVRHLGVSIIKPLPWKMHQNTTRKLFIFF